MHNLIKKAAFVAASAAALASVSFAPAQAEKADGPAGTVDTVITQFQQVGITKKKITIAAQVECDEWAEIGLHGQFKFKIVDVTASEAKGREVVSYRESIKATRINFCEALGILRAPRKKFKGTHVYAAFVYFDATKNHEEADSDWAGPEYIGDIT